MNDLDADWTYPSMKARGLQFSIRGLLFLTAVVAAFLMLAVRYPYLLIIVAFVGAFALLFVDGPLGLFKVMTSNRRPRLAKFTWAAAGTLFLVVAFGMGWATTLEQVDGSVVVWLMVAFYLFVAAMCYRAAVRISATTDA